MGFWTHMRNLYFKGIRKSWPWKKTHDDYFRKAVWFLGAVCMWVWGGSNHLSFIFFKLIFYLFLKTHIFLLERVCVCMHKPRKGKREREKGRRLPAEWKAPHRVPTQDPEIITWPKTHRATQALQSFIYWVEGQSHRYEELKGPL